MGTPSCTWAVFVGSHYLWIVSRTGRLGRDVKIDAHIAGI